MRGQNMTGLLLLTVLAITGCSAEAQSLSAAPSPTPTAAPVPAPTPTRAPKNSLDMFGMPFQMPQSPEQRAVQPPPEPIMPQPDPVPRPPTKAATLTPPAPLSNFRSSPVFSPAPAPPGSIRPGLEEPPPLAPSPPEVDQDYGTPPPEPEDEVVPPPTPEEDEMPPPSGPIDEGGQMPPPGPEDFAPDEVEEGPVALDSTSGQHISLSPAASMNSVLALISGAVALAAMIV